MKIGVRKLLRLGLVSARAWRGNAVGIAPTLWLNLRRQMAAAVHKIRYVFGIAALQSWLSFGIGIGIDLSQCRRCLRIKHFKIRKCSPSIDCDVERSSIDFAISTSLIHDIESWWKACSPHTSVQKLSLQQWKSFESVNFPKFNSRDRIPRRFLPLSSQHWLFSLFHS